MIDHSSQDTREMNAWGWMLSLALVAGVTLACMILGAFLGVASVADDAAGLVSPPPLPAPGIGIGGAEVLVAAALVFIWVHIGAAIGILVGFVSGTLACRGFLVPRLKGWPRFSHLVPAAATTKRRPPTPGLHRDRGDGSP